MLVPSSKPRRNVVRIVPRCAPAVSCLVRCLQGTLTFVRIYSGTLETGTFVSNPNKGKKERIGRIQLMHANNREDIKVFQSALPA